MFYLKEDNSIAMYCPALNSVGYGKTEKEAKKSFKIDLDIFLEYADEKKTLERCLLDYGWILKQVPEYEYTPPPIDKIIAAKAYKQGSIMFAIKRRRSV